MTPRKVKARTPLSDETTMTTREIVLWALDLHHDELGDHLDLSDEELQNLLATWEAI